MNHEMKLYSFEPNFCFRLKHTLWFELLTGKMLNQELEKMLKNIIVSYGTTKRILFAFSKIGIDRLTFQDKFKSINTEYLTSIQC